MHSVFGEELVLKLQKRIIDSIKESPPVPEVFGALTMMKWLKDNLTSKEIDLLADIESKAGEDESTQWLFEALSAGDSLPPSKA